MIIIYHKNNKVVELKSNNFTISDKVMNLTLSHFLFDLAKKYPDELLVWCHLNAKEQLNFSEIEKLFHHKKMLLSYNPSGFQFLDKSIGYVEQSPFIKINPRVTYPTWQMNSCVGAVHSQLLLSLKNKIIPDINFEYFLCSIAKLAMPKGVLCYSEPKLLKQRIDYKANESNLYTLFRFVRQHYKLRWMFLLFLNLFLYERKIPILPLISSFFYKNRNNNFDINFEKINDKTINNSIDTFSLDVIIPTIGRKEYLYDFLIDLKEQTFLPTNIIVVEQNPIQGSVSELDFITNQVWPFEILHTFTNQTGACNARNIALKQVTSDWVFFADDDIRIKTNFIKETLEKINNLGAKAVSLKCIENEDDSNEDTVFQWITFGSGSSFVFSECLKGCEFLKGYEFGYGEDVDFGMQLRNQGCDILYFSNPKITHLKAPIGGFRTMPFLKWQNDTVQPKPSPTVMLYLLLHFTKEQNLGYKTILFLKYYRLQNIKNPFSYFAYFKKQWSRSRFWANELNKTQ
jgi:glycosyltransferase involved in cell wall biosynthesis